MDQATKVFMDYAAAFEETYGDDDWSRLVPFFHEDASYEVRGGPFACQISGREAILAGLKKSIDGFDRRFSERQIELTHGPESIEKGDGREVSIQWEVAYQYRDAPKVVIPGRSVFKITDGRIVAMRDEYDDTALEPLGAWMLQHGEGLDGSYV